MSRRKLSPPIDVDSSQLRGLNGGVMLLATKDEKTAFDDMLKLGVPTDVATEVIAKRIAARTKEMLL